MITREKKSNAIEIVGIRGFSQGTNRAKRSGSVDCNNALLYSLCSSRSEGTVDVWSKDSWILAYVHVPCSWTLSFRIICCYIFPLRQPGSTLNVPLNTSGLATRYRYAASQRTCSFLLIWIYRFYWNGDEPSTSNFSARKYISRLEFLSNKNANSV